MASHPKLVNKQFNSPIGLYSPQNIQEVLDREAQILANGAVGINFQNPDVGKPSNLKNSAVLRMLEEEENRQRNGIPPGSYQTLARPLRENITWPPPEYEHKNTQRSTFKDVVVPGVKRVAWPPPSESGSDYVEQNSVSSQGGPQYSPQSPGFQQNNYQAPAQQQRPVSSNLPTNRPLKPLDVSTGTSSPLSSPLVNQSPAGFRSPTLPKGWAPVHSPVATPSPPSWQQHTQQQQLQQSSPQYQQSSTTSSTRYQTAHQSVSQQTFLGQQYTPSGQIQYQYQTQQQQNQPPQQQYKAPQQQYQSPQPQYQSPQQQYEAPQQQYQAPSQEYQPPQQQYQAPPQQQYQAPPQQQYQTPPQQQYQPPQQQYQPPQQQYQSPQQYQTSPQQQQFQASVQQNQAYSPSQSAPKPEAAPSQVASRAAPASRPVQPPPPSTITLRPNAPVSQAPPPLVTSQPATATFKVSEKNLRGDLKWPPEDVRRKIAEENVVSNDSFLSIQGGKHLRGDLKWPPECVKQQMSEENRLRLELAKGPAFRPKRPNKDYTEFFEQHALNSTYPGYKIPPGTQFFRPV